MYHAKTKIQYRKRMRRELIIYREIAPSLKENLSPEKCLKQLHSIKHDRSVMQFYIHTSAIGSLDFIDKKPNRLGLGLVKAVYK